MCGKYRVGDRVRIRKDLHEGLDCPSSVVDDMVHYKGMIATITKIDYDVYKIDIDDNEWEWDDIMFEGYAEKFVKEEDIKKMLEEADVIVSTVFETTTVVTIRLKNGFTLTESSGCIDPKNYNKEIGAEICMAKIEDKLWELEGYALNKKLSGGK